MRRRDCFKEGRALYDAGVDPLPCWIEKILCNIYTNITVFYHVTTYNYYMLSRSGIRQSLAFTPTPSARNLVAASPFNPHGALILAAPVLVEWSAEPFAFRHHSVHSIPA